MKTLSRGRSIHTLIFTDLDGTLLDDRYDLAAAANALDAVVKLGAVAIPVTSKTRRECEALNALRRIKTPLIFENGAGIAWQGIDYGDRASIEIEGPGYAELCERLDRVRVNGQFNFRGFNAMNAAELAERCGLSPEMASLALAREATEPLVWEDTESSRRAFAEYLSMFRLQLVEGGRFLHVMPQTDKGMAAAKVVQRWFECSGLSARTIGCGDSPNDQALLEFTSSCILFPRRDGSYLELGADKPVCHAPLAGHEAWLRAVTAHLCATSKHPVPLEERR
ncbi:MAG: HAD-IIB family hydrolase [Pseudomonadota bacterium]